jgi:hypothetical protein
MKHCFILVILAFSSLFSQAQTTLCEQTYTTGNYYVFEVAIPTTGNGLPTMAPLYAFTNTIQDVWEDSCFGGPCTHTVYNEYSEDTITTCIVYTLTDSLDNVDTLNCCFSQIWNSETMQWIMDVSQGNLTYVPDDNFETYLENNNMGNGVLGDDFVFTSNISEVEDLYINNLGIYDLTGIEDFSSLKSLNCNFNPNLLHLDLSNNTELLSVSANQIWGNEMGSLATIDISNSPNLQTLTCLHTQVTGIDVSNSPLLTVLNIGHNAIGSIDISNNIYLETLIVDNNLISEIDVTNNIILTTLDISDNPNLECADIRNGNNLEISEFNSTGNSNLYCINVDDSTYSTNNWTNILPQNYFSNNCDDGCYNIEMNCELLGIMITSSTESSINMISNTDLCMPPSLGPFSYVWTGYTTSGEFIEMYSSETLSIYLGDDIYLNDSVVICMELTAANQEGCEVCDTLFYNGAVYEWISINNPDQAVDLDCELIEIEIATQNDDYIEMTSNAFEIDGVLTYTWATNGQYGNTFYFDENTLYDTIVSCMSILDQYNETCEVCETFVLTDYGWVLESENVVDPNDVLLNICDSLNVFVSNSSGNSIDLTTNIGSLLPFPMIGSFSFSWESWGNYLNVDVVEGQNAYFDIPNNVESFYFLLQIVISSEQSESSALCIYPFLIQWDSATNTWVANSLTMSQMPTSTNEYSQSYERKLIKIVDALGRESQENKSMILFYMYDDGKIEKKFIIE